MATAASTPAAVTAPIPKPPFGAIVTKVEQYAATGEHTVSSWHVNGWLLLGAIVVANVVGIAFHI